MEFLYPAIVTDSTVTTISDTMVAKFFQALHSKDGLQVPLVARKGGEKTVDNSPEPSLSSFCREHLGAQEHSPGLVEVYTSTVPAYTNDEVTKLKYNGDVPNYCPALSCFTFP